MQTVQKTGGSTVQFWEGVDMLVGLQRQGCVQTVQKTVASEGAVLQQAWTSLRSCSDAVSQLEVPQIQLIAGVSGRPSCNRDGCAFSVVTAMNGLFSAFWPFFALLRVVPELSASFRSPR